MLLVISPAKTLDYDTPATTDIATQPEFLEQSQQLIDELRYLSPPEIGQLMSVSDKLSQLNAARFEAWSQPFTKKNAKQSVLAFKGDVYTGLDAESLSEQQLMFAQKHLRILSGLYGVLRPLDLMKAYRLEMGCKFTTQKGKGLYSFWGDLITEKLNDEIATQKNNILINLASNEYFKSVKTKQLKAQVITPVFKDWKGDKYKIISFYAKKARGLMCRYVIDNNINEAEELKGFDYQGYAYNQTMSSESEWVFIREAQ